MADATTPDDDDTDEPMLPGTGDPEIESELLDDIDLETAEDDGPADEELSIVDENGEGELPNELDDEE